MSKFAKRVQKYSRRMENAIVVGTAFGHLSEILEIYKNVFVIDDNRPETKAKNLVYKQGFSNLIQLSDVNAIFLDLSKVDQLKELKDCWQKNKSIILVEGNEPLERDKTKDLYSTGWGCTHLQGEFHVWEKIK